MKTEELINEAVALPVEERTLLVDSLLQSLSKPEPDLDTSWVKVAQRRLVEMRSGEVKSLPGELVFERIWNKFDK